MCGGFVQNGRSCAKRMPLLPSSGSFHSVQPFVYGRYVGNPPQACFGAQRRLANTFIPVPRIAAMSASTFVQFS